MKGHDHQQQVDHIVAALIDNTYLQAEMHTNAEFRAAVILLAGALPRFRATAGGGGRRARDEMEVDVP